MEHVNWELVGKWVGGTSFLAVLTLLLKHFVVSAPVKFAATTKSDNTLIIDLQARVAKLEADMVGMVKTLERTGKKLVRSNRERDALAFAHDMTCQELRIAALMHEKDEKPGTVLIERWKSARDSGTVIEELSPDEEEAI